MIFFSPFFLSMAFSPPNPCLVFARPGEKERCRTGEDRDAGDDRGSREGELGAGVDDLVRKKRVAGETGRDWG